MGNPISFNFLSEARQKEVLSLQSSSIFKQINTLHLKQNKICYLQEEISYLRIEEQLKNPSVQLKISEFEQLLKKGYVMIFPMHFGNERNISYHWLMKRDLMRNVFLQKLGQCK